jgi:hypothetical protein
MDPRVRWIVKEKVSQEVCKMEKGQEDLRLLLAHVRLLDALALEDYEAAKKDSASRYWPPVDPMEGSKSQSTCVHLVRKYRRIQTQATERGTDARPCIRAVESPKVIAMLSSISDEYTCWVFYRSYNSAYQDTGGNIG